jgi:hypothetical protein
MSSERTHISDKHGHYESGHDGQPIACNSLERVTDEANLEESDIAFISEIGFGTTHYEIPAHSLKCSDPVEIANRIAGALPVSTSTNTSVHLLKESNSSDGTYILLIRGSGSSDPVRVARIAEIKNAWTASTQKAEDTGDDSKRMNFSKMPLIQLPLVKNSDLFRRRVAAVVMEALGIDPPPNRQPLAHDTCVRNFSRRSTDNSIYLAHNFHSRNTETAWLVHGPERGATIYRQEEEVESCGCDTNQGIPVSDKRSRTAEDDTKTNTAANDTVLVAGQPTKSFPANGTLPAIEETDAGVTRFVPANAVDAYFTPTRPLDIAQGLAGYRCASYETVCTVVGSPLAANGLLYGRIPLTPSVCMNHTRSSTEHVILPNTGHWMQMLSDLSPDKSAFYFIGNAHAIRANDGTVKSYRISRELINDSPWVN